jgi:WD40 repeat protein
MKPAAVLQPSWTHCIDDYAIDAGWSPDSSLVAVASASGQILLLDARTGELQRTLSGHENGTMAVQWHPRDMLLASCGEDGQTRLWAATSDAPLAAMAFDEAWVEHCAWSPDGTYLAASAGKHVKLWDRHGSLVRSHAPAASTVADLAWRPDAKALAAGAYGGVALLTPDKVDPIRHYDFKGSVLDLAWSPNGRMLASGNQDASVHLWHADSGEDLHMSGYALKVRQLAWSADSRWLATGGGADVVLWDCSGKGPANSTPKMLREHTEPVTQIAWRPDGKAIASGCRGRKLAIWRPASPAQPRACTTLGGEPARLTFDRSGTRLLVADSAGHVAVYPTPG